MKSNYEPPVTEKCDTCAHICPHCGICERWYIQTDPDEWCKYYERREERNTDE